jgi:hypothetical protein
MAVPKFEELALSRLLLDNENPRHDPIDNEPEIIAQLIKSERVVALARAIAKKRGTSPLENIGVLEHSKIKGQYVVAEGNRRVCALKLLRDPQKAPTAQLKRTFAELKAEAGKLPDKVHVVLFADEDEANYWKGLRHQGEQEGVGTRAWGAEAKTRYAAMTGTAKNSNIVAVQLLDYAAKNKLIDKDDRDALSVTTVTRYISNPVVRNALGLASSKEFLIQAPVAEFNNAIQSFLQDAVPREGEDAPVNSRTDSKEREDYAAELRRKGHAVKTRLAKAVTPKAAAAATTVGGKNSRSADKRPHVVPVDFKAQIRSSVLKRVFDELRRIDPSEFSFATGYLLRAFLEQLAHQFAIDHGIGTTGELHLVIGRIATHFEKANAGQKVVKPLRVMESDRHSRLSPDTLGAWVHGSEIPSAAELKRRWDSLQAALRAMLDGLK